MEASIKQADALDNDSATPEETAAISVRSAETGVSRHDIQKIKAKMADNRRFVFAAFMAISFLAVFRFKSLCMFGIDICKNCLFIRFLACQAPENALKCPRVRFSVNNLRFTDKSLTAYKNDIIISKKIYR